MPAGFSAPDAPQGGTAVLEATETDTTNANTWCTWLHDDDHTPQQVVIVALTDVLNLSEGDATTLMVTIEASPDGKAVVKRGNRRECEKVAEQLAGFYGLHTTVTEGGEGQ